MQKSGNPVNNNPKHLKKEIETPSNSGSETRIERTRSPLLKKLTDEGLDCDYYRLYTYQQADEILRQCEEQLVFNSGREAQVRVFGKWHETEKSTINFVNMEPGSVFDAVLLFICHKCQRTLESCLVLQAAVSSESSCSPTSNADMSLVYVTGSTQTCALVGYHLKICAVPGFNTIGF